MEIATLAVLGIGLVVIGSGVTFLMAAFIPSQVLARAQKHGRFAGLSANEPRDDSGKKIAAGYWKVGEQTTNAC
jgi:hypothetical protein